LTAFKTSVSLLLILLANVFNEFLINSFCGIPFYCKMVYYSRNIWNVMELVSITNFWLPRNWKMKFWNRICLEN
jgi:hypothetical protein